MVKSKFQSKVQEKVGSKSEVIKTKSKYYDETISTSKSPKSNNGFAVFVIVCIIIGASVSGILIAKNNDPNNGTDPNDNNNNPDDGIQDGDIIYFKYKFFMDINHDLLFSEDELVDNADAFQWKVEKDSAQGFPPGLYINILGMNLGDTKNIFLPPNIDEDGDGKDDVTGEDVLSFGSGPFVNTALKYDVEILVIN